MSESLQALRRANPRAEAGFDQSVELAAAAVREQIGATALPHIPRSRRHLYAGGVAVAAGAVAAALLTIGSPGTGPGVESAAAAVERAAGVTAASARRSGTAVVRITHNGEVWAGTTVRWHDDDVAISNDAPARRGRAGSGLLAVGGTLYGFDPSDGGWVVLGDPSSIDPDSGTTPHEYLAAVREDVGGPTLRRIAGGMTGLTTSRLDDGSSVYRGAVTAGLIARESGFKEGSAIRVFPFGYVAHDEAADPAALLDVAVTVAPGGVVRELAVTWGTSASAWTYTVSYSRLGSTPAPVAPADARPLRRG